MAAAEGRLPRNRKLIIDVCTDAMSAAFDVCHRHVPYEVRLMYPIKSPRLPSS